MHRLPDIGVRQAAAGDVGSVQQHLAASKRKTRIRGQAVEANLLSRLLFDADGNGLVSDHAVKKSRRYRYYVTKPDVADPMRIEGPFAERMT